jgi:hypothetical protein
MLYKKRLESLLSGLECEDVEAAVESDPEKLKMMGMQIAKHSKRLNLLIFKYFKDEISRDIANHMES